MARIELNQVFKAYGNNIPVIRDVSLDIGENEFCVFVGPSGCGKTTMMNLVAGFVMPTAGQVTLDGVPIAGPGPNRGVIFQEYGVFPWLTVRDNIAFGLTLGANRVPAKERDAICARYMGLMGLADFADAFPKTLSGGMRQRLALARAYSVKPEFLPRSPGPWIPTTFRPPLPQSSRSARCSPKILRPSMSTEPFPI